MRSETFSRLMRGQRLAAYHPSVNSGELVRYVVDFEEFVAGDPSNEWAQVRVASLSSGGYPICVRAKDVEFCGSDEDDRRRAGVCDDDPVDTPGQWFGKPLEHGLKNGKLTLEKYNDPVYWERANWWVVYLEAETVLNENSLVKRFPVVVGAADKINRATHEWLISLLGVPKRVSAARAVGGDEAFEDWDVGTAITVAIAKANGFSLSEEVAAYALVQGTGFPVASASHVCSALERRFSDKDRASTEAFIKEMQTLSATGF